MLTKLPKVLAQSFSFPKGLNTLGGQSTLSDHVEAEPIMAGKLVCLGGSPAVAREAFSLSSAACPFRFAQYSRSVMRFLLPFSKSI